MSEAAPGGAKHLLLQAAIDNELNAAGILAFEQAMREDEALAADYARLVALREAFRRVPKTHASDGLRARVAALAAQGTPTLARARRINGWQPAAIAASIAFILGGGVTSLVLPQAPSAATQVLLASHVRSVMSGQTTDVLSSDRHTVKPWFAAHSAISPDVTDLAKEGFTLVGGRLDVVGVTPVPTLVYQHGKHVISLSIVPKAVAKLAAGERLDEGYVVLSWQLGEATYVAISDTQASELEAFAAAYRKATGAAQ
jgi:anti-sigma factor RsiW